MLTTALFLVDSDNTGHFLYGKDIYDIYLHQSIIVCLQEITNHIFSIRPTILRTYAQR